MLATLLSLSLSFHGSSAPCPLQQQDGAAALHVVASAAMPMPPVPPIPPAPPLPPGPLPHLFGAWPDDPGAVSVNADRSVDEAVTGIVEDAHLNLVLNTGSEGEADVPGAVSQLSPRAALSAVLAKTPLVATRVGAVVVVHDQQSRGGDPLQGSGIAGGAKLSARSDETIDAAVTRIAAAAGWSVISNTDEAGDALVRLRFTDVPADEGLRAVLTGTTLGAHLTGTVVTVAPREGLAHANTLTGFDAPTGKAITLAGKKRVDATLERIAQAAGWTLHLDTEDAGDAKLVLDLRNVPVEQALAAVIAGSPLVATKKGNEVSVSTADCSHGACVRSSDEDDEAAAMASAPAGDSLRGFDGDLDEEFSGDFTDTPVDEALRKVADSASLSLVLPRALHGSVTAHFHEAQVEDVLRAILSQNGLVATKRGTVITVERLGHVAGGAAAPVNVQALVEQTKREVQRALEHDSARAQHDLAQAQHDADSESDAPSHAGDHLVTGDVVLAPGEKARDLVALHGNAKLGPGSHARAVTSLFGSVDIGPGAVVEREITAIGGDVHVAPGARVGGDATAIGGKVIIDPGASVKERTSVRMPGLSSLGHVAETATRPSFSPLATLAWMLAEFALFFALGLILLVFWPRRLERVAAALSHTPTRSTAIGMLAVMAIPVLTVLLLLTVVGSPLVLLEVVGLPVGEVLGLSALALAIGRRLPVDVGRQASVANLALGTAAIVIAIHLPIIGTLVMVCAFVVALGAVVSTRFGQADTSSPLDAPLPG